MNWPMPPVTGGNAPRCIGEPYSRNGQGNTEATRFGGESVETAREAPQGAGEDTVRPPVKAGDAGGNDQRAVRKGRANSVTFTVVYSGSGIMSIAL